MNKTFPKEVLQEIVGTTKQRDCGEYGIFEVVHETIVEHTRWSVQSEMVFRAPDGNLYTIYFSEGATEMQDERAFENEPDNIECAQVEVKMVETVTYVPIGEA